MSVDRHTGEPFVTQPGRYRDRVGCPLTIQLHSSSQGSQPQGDLQTRMVRRVRPQIGNDPFLQSQKKRLRYILRQAVGLIRQKAADLPKLNRLFTQLRRDQERSELTG